MTKLLTNYSIDNIIEKFKKPRECNEVSIDEMLNLQVQDLKIMLQYGWPYQDTYETDDEELSGVPINLAKIVLLVCDFCAKHNIDLSDAIGLTLQRG